uniref:Uncharacterized protein n=1 Tax=Arundo donax TaxID=35708 RepID=A0A0A9CFF2_ARUDO
MNSTLRMPLHRLQSHLRPPMSLHCLMSLCSYLCHQSVAATMPSFLSLHYVAATMPSLLSLHYDQATHAHGHFVGATAANTCRNSLQQHTSTNIAAANPCVCMSQRSTSHVSELLRSISLPLCLLTATTNTYTAADCCVYMPV